MMGDTRDRVLVGWTDTCYSDPAASFRWHRALWATGSSANQMVNFLCGSVRAQPAQSSF
jgi:hypothetical protein